MAGAGLFAGAEDPSALFGNPAGLGWMSTSMIGADFSVQRARSNTAFVTPTDRASADRTVSDYQLGSLAGAYSFPTERGSMVIGMSLHPVTTYERGFDVAGANTSTSITGTFLPSSFEVEGDEIIFDDVRSRIAYEAGAIDYSQAVFEEGGYPFFAAADPRAPAVEGRMEIRQQDNVRRSGQLNELATGLAVEVAPGIMLGGGVNLQFGTFTFERFYRETDASGLLPPGDPNNPQRPYDPYFLENTTLEGFREVQLEERIDTEINGVNLRFGLSAQVTDGLRGGLLIESPTWFNLTREYGTLIRTDFDCDFSLSGPPCPEGGVEGFESGDLTGADLEYRLRTPWRLGAGLQYTRAGLTVAGDVEMVDWTQARVRADDASFTALNRQIEDLDATFNSRVGAEYAFDRAVLRAGVAYRPDPRELDFQDVDGQTTDGDRLFLSAGVSYTPDDQFSLHLNWLQARFDDEFISYEDEGDSEEEVAPTIRERVAHHQFQIGITYRP
jgi:opacity protein-like surface antigen